MLMICNYSFYLLVLSDPSFPLVATVYGDVQSSMASNKLLMNPSKTEFLLLGTMGHANNSANLIRSSLFSWVACLLTLNTDFACSLECGV